MRYLLDTNVCIRYLNGRSLKLSNAYMNYNLLMWLFVLSPGQNYSMAHIRAKTH